MVNLIQKKVKLIEELLFSTSASVTCPVLPTSLGRFDSRWELYHQVFMLGDESYCLVLGLVGKVCFGSGTLLWVSVLAQDGTKF